MFTQEEQYTEVLESIPGPQQIQQDNSHVNHEESSVGQDGGTVQHGFATIEEACTYYESLYNNLAKEVEKVNMVFANERKTNATLKTELARYENLDKNFQIDKAKFDEINKAYSNSVYQSKCLTQKMNALHLSSGKQISTLNDEIANLNDLLSKEKSTVSRLEEDKKKLKADFKRSEDSYLEKLINADKRIKELDNMLIKQDQSIQTLHMLTSKPDSFYHEGMKEALGYPNPHHLKQAQKKQPSLYNGHVLLNDHVPPVVYDSEETLDLAQESRLKMQSLNREIKPAHYPKINSLYETFVSSKPKKCEDWHISKASKTTHAPVTYSISIDDDADFTPSVARKFLNEVKDTIVMLQHVVNHRMNNHSTNVSSSARQEIQKVFTDEIVPIVNQVDARVQNFEHHFVKEAAKFVGEFKSLAKEADDSLDKVTRLERDIEQLLKANLCNDIVCIVKHNSVDNSSSLQTELDRMKEKMEQCILKKENEYTKLWNDWNIKCNECKYDKISYDKAYNDMQQQIKRLQAQLGDLKGKSIDSKSASCTLEPMAQKLEDENVSLEFQVRNYAKENAHLKNTFKTQFDSIKMTRAQNKNITDSLQQKLLDTIYENATLRARLFTKLPDHKTTPKGTSKNTQFSKQSILGKPQSFIAVTPFPKTAVPPKNDKSNALPKQVTSNSVPPTREFKNDRVIAPGMFKMNPTQTPRVASVLPKQSSASIRKPPISTHVTSMKTVNSNSNGLSSSGVESTTKTRRPQLKSNTRNDRVTSAPSSSCPKNKEVEEHHRNLLLSKNKKHVSFECNNVKIAIRNDKHDVVCAMCKQCLISANHDKCLLKHVTDLNSRRSKQKANVSKGKPPKKYVPKAKKPNNLGSTASLASPKPSTTKKWTPTGRMFDSNGKIVVTSQNDSSLEDMISAPSWMVPLLTPLLSEQNLMDVAHLGHYHRLI